MKRIHIHREGHPTILIVGITLLIINLLVNLATNSPTWLDMSIGAASIAFFLFIVSFFRNPTVFVEAANNHQVLAPADGKVVVIEEVEEPEYFKDKRIQVSIFMSPANVHVNRAPIGGTVKYTKYHPGNYLVAWHPKSSTLNERFTSVIESTEAEMEILVRQIAGKVARKISNYLDEGEAIMQGDEFGFIKFGSRVDIFLPLDTNICVSLQEKVKGGRTVLAKLA